MKIVGFKSFVESTSLFFKSNRVAIVGPNGCGKSNVIDAIRWVMGESSPKYLRGDQMADVIFNGSMQRKPSGIALIEIVLDNRHDYLQGAYVVKGDVALRREINRNGESTYYINGQRVRRKDLTDLWLGTGAGARGYAIIGQNMVNHLVEANPEVLRGYLEEAAGVSKYKERRRESAERLKQVAENLIRIDDIIADLHSQLERLEHEAADAKHFHQLRQQLRQHKEQMDLAKARALFLKHESLAQQHEEQEKRELKLKEACELKQQELNHFDLKQQTLQFELQNQEQNLFKRRIACEQEQKFFTQRQQEQERHQFEHQQTLDEIDVLQKQILQERNITEQQKSKLEALETETQALQDDIQELSTNY